MLKNNLTRSLSFIFLLIILTLNINIVSAFEFDNVKEYNPITREVIIYNSFLGIKISEVGKARLNTPLNVLVPKGYQKVAEFDLWAYEDYNNALKKFTFKDMKNGGNKINRDYDLKYLSYKEIKVYDYKYDCEGISYPELCAKIDNGYHYESREVWNKITPTNLRKNEKLTIGVFTEVMEGDFIDWIPTIYGVKIKEWATWTETSAVTQAHGVTLGSTSSSTLAVRGMNITIGAEDVVLVNYSIHASTVTNGTAILINGTGISGGSAGSPVLVGGVLASAPIVGGVATFSTAPTTNVTLLAGEKYGVLVWATGTIKFAGTGFPIENSFINWTKGMFNGASSQNNEVNDILSIGVAPLIPDFSPIVILNSPLNNTNYTISPLLVNFSCYGSDDINFISMGLYINGSLDQLNASGINNTNYTFSKILTDGNYNWTCEGTDNASATTKPTIRSFTIHTVSPDSIIHYPTGIIDYHLTGDTLVLNWTVNESGQNLTTHITNCTYTYNEVVTEINNTVCTQTNQTTFIPVVGVYNLTFTVTDEYGLQNTSFTSWDIKVFEINQTYNNQTTEGSLETFLGRIRLGSGYSISEVVLIYNNTLNIGQSFTSGLDTVLRKINLLVPNVEENTNITFYWNLTLSDSTKINLSFQNQTILNLALDNCTVFTNELLNITVVDEADQTILPNATIEIAVNILDRLRSITVVNLSSIYEAINPLRICLNINITNSSIYSMDTIIRYVEETHANEYYNIVNFTLTNSTTSQQLTLYDLNLSQSTEFQLTFIGSDFLPVENALVNVDRQYISENLFKTVELPKTDYNGQTVIHLVRNNVLYNIRITKDGIVLGNFENLVAFCDDFTIGDCNIELNAFDSVEAVFDYNENIGIIFQQPTYNATNNLISFNFITSDGSTKNVIMQVTRNDIFGNRSICNASIVSSGATLSCSIPSNLDDTKLNTNIFVDNILSVRSAVTLDSTNYGPGGLFVGFVFAFSLILLFSTSKEGVLISMIIGSMMTIGLGIYSGDIIGVGASVMWLLVIVVVGLYKLNKDRHQ